MSSLRLPTWKIIILWALKAAMIRTADFKAGLMSSGISVLVAKSLEAYERVDVDRANFFALGFFIIALCSLVVYAIVGWCSNVIAQVRRVPTIVL